ncbi:MAG TPA: type II toxin-antitoxin system PemK/MazF family toxin [Ignavibacteria bacterium]|nr:type II toxin-antitoxin system PemK/MazF family toxin [Ignavibacteria bacterium]HMQ98726.1 type II toxin-antitoxin system PemK/MazF family toxin [Ignavibacteria bacterium]
MGSFAVGDVILVKFPFSDLSGYKLRPAVVIIDDLNNDHILCQITSKEYSDMNAIKINPSDCLDGSLEMISYIRPLKLFTANESIFLRKICSVKLGILKTVNKKLIDLINTQETT